jgi:putative ATP-dependent endonuclease of the OLD family
VITSFWSAKGVILVEGWAEELLVPALAKLMKARGLITQDLTEAGVSVVNVGGTSYLRYAKILLRRSEPQIGIPVSIITDLDVPEFEKQGNDFVQREHSKLAAEKDEAANKKAQDLNDGPVRAFLAPDWTLEFSLCKSKSFGKLFEESFRNAHPKSGVDNLELEVAKKLINKGLEKQHIAYLMAKAIEAGISGPVEIAIEDDEASAKYLIEGIKYACGIRD